MGWRGEPEVWVCWYGVLKFRIGIRHRRFACGEVWRSGSGFGLFGYFCLVKCFGVYCRVDRRGGGGLLDMGEKWASLGGWVVVEDFSNFYAVLLAFSHHEWLSCCVLVAMVFNVDGVSCGDVAFLFWFGWFVWYLLFCWQFLFDGLEGCGISGK